LTSCLTISGAPIDDLIVAVFTHSVYIQEKSPNAEQNFFAESVAELGAFLPPNAIGGLINCLLADNATLRWENGHSSSYHHETISIDGESLWDHIINFARRQHPAVGAQQGLLCLAPVV